MMKRYTSIVAIMAGITIMACSKSEDKEMSEQITIVKASFGQQVPLLFNCTTSYCECWIFAQKQAYLIGV